MNMTTFPSYPGHDDGQGQQGGNQQRDFGQATQPQTNFQAPQQNQEAQRPTYQAPQATPAPYQRDNAWQNNNGGGGNGNANNGGGGGWQGNKGGGNWQGNKGGGGGWQGNKGGGNWKDRPKETDMSLYKPYAIVANNDAPAEILVKFQEIAHYLESKGYTLRTRGMEGADDAVEKTVQRIEVHLPWREFNGKQSKFTFNTDRAFAIAKMFHPTFDTMKKGIQAFLASNARLVMGDKMVSPALFLICWTEDGAESIRSRTSRTGFAGHPIAIASALGIPVFNLSKPDAQQRLTFLVESTNVQ